MKEIPLTQGRIAIVDDDDFDALSEFKWYYAQGYARTNLYIKGTKKQTTIGMHRFIMATPPGCDTDHINGNTLDNRRENLRTCSRTENSRNSNANAIKKFSKYKGVTINNGKWRAQIFLPKKKAVHLGYFETEIEAARAFDDAAVKHFGKFARLNFKKGETTNG